MWPDMPPLAGVLARGTTVVVVMAAILWSTKFFKAEELRALNALRVRRRQQPPVTTPPESVEMAGEIVGTDVQDEAIAR